MTSEVEVTRKAFLVIISKPLDIHAQPHGTSSSHPQDNIGSCGRMLPPRQHLQRFGGQRFLGLFRWVQPPGARSPVRVHGTPAGRRAVWHAQTLRENPTCWKDEGIDIWNIFRSMMYIYIYTIYYNIVYAYYVYTAPAGEHPKRTKGDLKLQKWTLLSFLFFISCSATAASESMSHAGARRVTQTEWIEYNIYIQYK